MKPYSSGEAKEIQVMAFSNSIKRFLNAGPDVDSETTFLDPPVGECHPKGGATPLVSGRTFSSRLFARHAHGYSVQVKKAAMP